MVQILPQLNYIGQQQPKKSGFGEFLGGVATGLQGLAERKLAEKTAQLDFEKRKKAWTGIGLPENVAEFLVQQPESIQRDFLERLEGFNLNGQQQQSNPQQQSEFPVGEEKPGLYQEKQAASNLRFGANKEDKKRMHEEQQAINKEVHPFIQDVQHKARGAKESDLRLNRMEKLIETGKLNNPQFASFLKTLKKGIGYLDVDLDLTSLLSAESQEFDKLSGDFIKNAKDIFGSKITDQDLKAFLTTIPTLAQSNQGKLAVIRNLKLFNKAAKIREKAARALLKKYGNRPPLDFEAEVEDAIKPELDEITAQFEQGSEAQAAGTSHLVTDILGALAQPILGKE